MTNQTQPRKPENTIPGDLCATARRLEESKKNFLSEIAETYGAYGEAWARDIASYKQLHYLSDCSNDAWGGVMELTAEGVYYPFDHDWTDEDIASHMEFWEDATGCLREYLSPPAYEAFARGALRPWNQVSGLI